MRFTALLVLTWLLCSCGAGGAGPTVPAPQPAAQSATTQAATTETTATTVTTASTSGAGGAIYLGYATHVDVYPKNASGAASPIRTLNVSAAAAILAEDSAHDLYVSDGSWSIREYRAGAQGNAAPIATYTLADPLPNPSAYDHFLNGIGVRWDGGIAVLVSRMPANSTAYSSQDEAYFGIVDPKSSQLQIVERIADGVSGPPGASNGISVDGSGNVIVTYGYLAPFGPSTTLGSEVRRFSTHPDGFYDDGPLTTFGNLDGTVAVSQTNQLYAAQTLYPVDLAPLAAGTPLQVPCCPIAPADAAFDAKGRLFVLSTQIRDFPIDERGTFVRIFPPKSTSSTTPTILTITTGSAGPGSIAVTNEDSVM